MQIFDTHCHYNLEPLYSGKVRFFSKKAVSNLKAQGWKDHWQRAQEAGVVGSLIPGSTLESSNRAVKIAVQQEKLYASTAIHPSEVIRIEPQQLETDFEKISKLAAKKQVKAIGETGLDYFHLPEQDKDKYQKLQKNLFIQHILLANKLKKPLIIHARAEQKKLQKAAIFNQILEMIKTYYQFYQPFVLHCVSGPSEYVQQALEMGAYISFAGNLTYPSAQHLRDLFKLVPPGQLLLETDAPFLAPQKYRGQINQPCMISETADYVSSQFNVDMNQVLQNSCQFYNLNSEECYL